MSNTILITGASSGIGKATAKYFNSKGWNVIATMRSPEKETELKELENVLVTRLDVTDSQSILDAVNAGTEAFGSIDVLLNNAGYGAFGPLEAFSMDKIQRQFEVNIFGLLETTKAILPIFRANKKGVVINISSMGGKTTFPFGSLYHGTKYAVEGISEALSYELEAIGSKIKIVEPGIIKTDFAGRSMDAVNDDSLTEYQPTIQKFVQASTQQPRFESEPQLVAEVIYQAATDGSNQIRYVAGDDARELIKARDSLSDAELMQVMKNRFGL